MEKKVPGVVAGEHLAFVVEGKLLHLLELGYCRLHEEYLEKK